MTDLRAHRSHRPVARRTLATLALTAALWPHQSWAAGCGPLDVAACADGAEYSLYAGLAGLAWTIDRMLLQLAYQLDQLRWWLVQVAFTSAYQQLTQFVSPLYVPVTTVALTIACLLFMLVPFTGRVLLSMRQVILWATLTPLLLSVSGQLVAQTEQIRSSIGSSLFTEASAAAPGAIFGVSATDMAEPRALYPANPCGTGQLTRQAATGQLHMDDLAAALLYADASDIHCPDRRGPGALIPDRFYDATPGFATAQYVSEMATVNDRRAAVEGMQRGLTRLAMGFLPCLLAVCEMLVHLVFSLSLAVVWVSLPIGLIFIAFQGSGAGVAALLRRIIAVLQVSWSASFVMGLLFATLLSAAELGNAAAYAGFSLAGLLLTGYLAVIAFGSLRASFGAVSTVVESGTGLALQPAVQVIQGTAAGSVAAAATTAQAVQGAAAGGIAGAAIAAMAGRTRGTSYAASAVLGRVPGMMALGEVAASMGLLPDDKAIYRGLRAGYASTQDWRWARMSIDSDSRITQPRPGSAKPASAASARAHGPLPPSTSTTTSLEPEAPPPAPIERVQMPDQEIVIVDGEVIVTHERRRPRLGARPRALPVPMALLSAPTTTADERAATEDASPEDAGPADSEDSTSPATPGTPEASPSAPAAGSGDVQHDAPTAPEAVQGQPRQPAPPERRRSSRRPRQTDRPAQPTHPREGDDSGHEADAPPQDTAPAPREGSPAERSHDATMPPAPHVAPETSTSADRPALGGPVAPAESRPATPGTPSTEEDVSGPAPAPAPTETTETTEPPS